VLGWKDFEEGCKRTNTEAEGRGLIAWFGWISTGELLPGKYLILVKSLSYSRDRFPCTKDLLYTIL
jgi:hypothetical protein